MFRFLLRLVLFLLVCRWYGHKWVWDRIKPSRRTRDFNTSGVEYLGCRRCGTSQDGLGDMTRYSKPAGRSVRRHL